MVRQGDFEVKLVEAQSKVPFKEFSHDGKIYVEAEPGQEYFISIEKKGTEFHSGTLLTDNYVDGKSLVYPRAMGCSEDLQSQILRQL